MAQSPFQLFQQARLIDPTTGLDEVGDLLVEDGAIAARAPHLDPPPGAEVRDCRGLVIGPGLVDLYSQSGEPGFESRETLASLAAAATAGGFSRLALLPTTQPAIDNAAQLTQQRSFQLQPRQSGQSGQAQLYFWGALTQGAEGQHMGALWELAEAGAVGFCDGRPIENLALVRRLLEYGGRRSLPIALWARDRRLAGQGVAREGPLALQLGLPGDPELSETAALASLIECVRATGTPTHAMRLSTARGVELLGQAKAAGIPITASVSWMHLLFSNRDLDHYDPHLRLDPPIGTPRDQAALIEATRTGLIDAIAIDHSPHSYEEKTVAFGVAPPGAIGLEFAFPLLWQRFVAPGLWPALTLWERLSRFPAHYLHQSAPSLAIAQSEWLLFDPQATWPASPAHLKSLSANSPFVGSKIRGSILQLHVSDRRF